MTDSRTWPWEPRCNHVWDDPEFPPAKRCRLRLGHERTHLAVHKQRDVTHTVTWGDGEGYDAEIGSKIHLEGKS